MERSIVYVPRVSLSFMGENPFLNRTDIPFLSLHPLQGSEVTSSILPSVSVGCCHTSTALHLRFVVTEISVRAAVTYDNGSVWEDSCVEFFVRPDNSPFYYNFEFNSLGYCLLACGTSRFERQLGDLSLLNCILRAPSIIPSLLGLSSPVTWMLDVSIPCEAFFLHSISCLDGLRMRANLYKCGNKLSLPHYLSWSTMPLGHPDFHQPRYFGDFILGC